MLQAGFGGAGNALSIGARKPTVFNFKTDTIMLAGDKLWTEIVDDEKDEEDQEGDRKY